MPTPLTLPYHAFKRVETAHTHSLGQQVVTDGQVGALIVAGGQGTRLHFKGPKGCFEILPGQSLFALFAKQIFVHSQKAKRPLSLAIMTSSENYQETYDHFKQHNFFNLDPEFIDFFIQSKLPVQDKTGNPILDSHRQAWLAPAGNGVSLFDFVDQELWQKWIARGIQYLNFVQVDNLLADPFDYSLIGYHALQKSDVTIKAILRDDPNEKVGVIVLKDQKVAVIEYNEISAYDRLATNPQGRLVHPCANISLFCFDMHFIKKIYDNKIWQQMPLHIAYKNIPALGKKCNKLEYFIFDVLPFSKKTHVLVYPRAACFAPLKELNDLPYLRSLLQK